MLIWPEIELMVCPYHCSNKMDEVGERVLCAHMGGCIEGDIEIINNQLVSNIMVRVVFEQPSHATVGIWFAQECLASM